MSIDLNAFNKFFIDYQQRFVHFACTYVHDEAVAEDFVVESMMYYWENKDRLSADTNIPAYVLTTIKHKCIDYLRHQQVYQDASDEIARIYAWELSGRIMTLEDFEPYEVFTKEIQEIVDKKNSITDARVKEKYEWLINYYLWFINESHSKYGKFNLSKFATFKKEINEKYVFTEYS